MSSASPGRRHRYDDLRPDPRHAFPAVDLDSVFQRRVVAARLWIVPDEMAGGHLPALARPEELAERLDAYVT